MIWYFKKLSAESVKAAHHNATFVAATKTKTQIIWKKSYLTFMLTHTSMR